MLKNDKEVDFLISNEQFEKKIQKIEQISKTRLLAYRQIMKCCREILELYRSGIRTWRFNSVSEEVLFFKEHKQIPLNLLHFLSRIAFIGTANLSLSKKQTKASSQEIEKDQKILHNQSGFEKSIICIKTFLK